MATELQERRAGRAYFGLLCKNGYAALHSPNKCLLKKVRESRLRCGVHFTHYNFVRVHPTLRCTAAMAAGVTQHLWEIEDIVALLDK